MTARLCLNMIVRDEAPIIDRCLTSLRDHIHTSVIVDTGSTDGTPDIIRRVLKGVGGTVITAPFENFEQARNVALKEARKFLSAGIADFTHILLADADMELVVTDPAWRECITGAHQLIQRSTHLSYRNTRIVPADSPARYVGATHEYLDTGARPPLLEGAHFLDHTDGSSRTNKFTRDIALLTEAHVQDPTNARTVFYLAQSYRDNGDLGLAANTYAQRVRMAGWDEETWYARYQIACLNERRELHPAVVTAAYLTAYQTRPTRNEPLVDLARYHRNRGQHHLAALYATQAVHIPMPTGSLFVDHSAYEWRALDEYAIATYWTGRRKESANACTRLLTTPGLPAQQRARVLTNLGHALERNPA